MAILQGARITGSIIATTFIKANGFSGSITASNLYVLGKAGIGTTSPDTLLEISSSTAASLLNVKGAGGNGILFVSGGGNVGIGTTAPDLRLHIEATNAYPASSGTTPTGFLKLRSKTVGETHGMYVGVANASPYGSWIQCSDSTNLAVNYPLLLIPNGGNVGIGTTSPN